ncbi:carboxymuconolactone decarboxylase family protein [Paenibacillus sp. sptzw28]|uniref:carboxymuconolactone decarboxylase family protein n=1 Tax=Paenibacillus sp. sptzw28 TaxID=715179 RepID=UPI001C6DE181|nr:carboxymuconolactone decarboxylase family protein [Paenibacillus sp. sptzw28]QYR19265.1 carboxymuconolactone decarboxylase family protein [Paenibacillus sp. sptzw28]
MLNNTMDDKVDAYKVGVGLMNESLPNVVEAYDQFTAECFADRALSGKHKQLVALGIALFANNEICTYYHVTEAISKGASPNEIMDAVAVAAAVGGGHAFSQGVTRVQQALSGKPASNLV